MIRQSFIYFFMIGYFGLFQSGGLLWAQEENKFVRKSISHLEVLFRLDGTSSALNEAEKQQIIRALNSELKLGRFDLNPLPQGATNALVATGRQLGIQEVSQLEGLLTQVLSNKVSEIVQDSSFGRSETLQSESQKESFMAVKAKSLDITGDQYSQILNASYVYIPTIAGVQISRIAFGRDRGYHVELTLGLAWFQLKIDDFGNSEYEMIGHFTSRGVGESSSQLPTDHRSSAYREAYDKAITNLVFETQSFEAFKLRGQVLEGGIRSAVIDLGTSSGLYLNQRFRHFEMIQKEDTIVKNNLGWGYIHDLDSAQVSGLHLISGFADQGQSIEEIPLSGMSLQFGYEQGSWELETPYYSSDTLETYPQTQIYLGTNFDISNKSGINSTFFKSKVRVGYSSINGEIAPGLNDPLELNTAFLGELELGLNTQWHLWNRFFAGVEAGVSMYSMLVSPTNTNSFNTPDINWVGNVARLSLVGSFELTPRWSLLAQYGQRYSNVWYQEYQYGSDQPIDCRSISYGCFDPDFDSQYLSLSAEYRMGKISTFFQRIF